MSTINMKPNNFVMKVWHIKHVEKIITRYFKGVSPQASSFEKSNFKKYDNILSCLKQIEYDIKHGITTQEVYAVTQKIRNNEYFSQLHAKQELLKRLDELERQLAASKKIGVTKGILNMYMILDYLKPIPCMSQAS